MDRPVLLVLGGENAVLIYSHSTNCASRKRSWFGLPRRCDCGSPGIVSTNNEALIRETIQSIFATQDSGSGAS